MKAITILCAGLLLATTGVRAQRAGSDAFGSKNNLEIFRLQRDSVNRRHGGWEFGARFMPVFSSMEIRTADNGVIQPKFSWGYGFGFDFGYNFTNHVGLQTEVFYNVLTQKWRDRSLDRRLRLNYVNVPLLFSFNTGKNRLVNFNLVGGPQFGLNVGSHFDAGGDGGMDTVTAVLAVRRGDLGVAYGAGFDFGTRWHFDVGFRGYYGLIDISDQTQSVATHEYFLLDRAHVEVYALYVGISYLL